MEIDTEAKEFEEYCEGIYSNALTDACWKLLDNIKRRYPEEDRKQWRCQDMAKIAHIIGFE